MKPLKFANIAKAGDRIRAYDFRPMSDRVDRYVEGVVLDPCDKSQHFNAYKIEVDTDTVFTTVPRDIVFVPHEVGFTEFDNRVMFLESPQQKVIQL